MPGTQKPRIDTRGIQTIQKQPINTIWSRILQRQDHYTKTPQTDRYNATKQGTPGIK